MWRKLLILCLLGMLCPAVNAGDSMPTSGHSRERTIPAADHAPSASEARRIALVIGNSGYMKEPLSNPVNDARAMSRALKSLGFEVLLYEDLSQQRMADALQKFKQRLDDGGVGLFYFAGHGLQVAGKTLLLPVDIDSRAPARLLTQVLDLRSILASMSQPRAGKLNVVILDTCLNNPFDPAPAVNARSFPDVPEQTLIAYATAPGEVADDGAHHGLYTAALLNSMQAPDRDITQVFQQAASAVHDATGQWQTPWISSSVSSSFRFAAAAQRNPSLFSLEANASSPAGQSRAILPKDSAEQYELTFWESIKDSDHISDYQAYLEAYPNGRFAALARARIERLRAAAPKAEPKAETPAEKAPARQPAPPPAAAPAEPARAPAAKSAPEKRRPPAAAPVAPEEARPAPSTAPTEPSTGGTAGSGEIRDCPTCPVMIALRAGAFTMGSSTGDPSEKPPHRVTISTPFAIGKTEVTVEQWNACVEAGACPSVTSNASASRNAPVRDVSWDDAQQYVKWLSKVSGKAYRLPTEAEWEYAARGGTSTRYWWGEQMRPGKANCKDCGQPWRQDAPADVATFAANPFGLHDMNGSVWEWVSDCWHNTYKGAPTNGHAWDTPNCRVRVIRGGSWREGANYMPSTTRFKYDASVRHSQNGLRVARDVK